MTKQELEKIVDDILACDEEAFAQVCKDEPEMIRRISDKLNRILASKKQEKIGIARFVFERIEKSEDTKWNHGIEVYQWDAFSTNFLASAKSYGYDHVIEVISECGQGEVLDQVCDELKLAPGFYEIIGDVYYEFDPGFDSPNGPADPNEWWWLENATALKLTDEQVKRWTEQGE